MDSKSKRQVSAFILEGLQQYRKNCVGNKAFKTDSAQIASVFGRSATKSIFSGSVLFKRYFLHK